MKEMRLISFEVDRKLLKERSQKENGCRSRKNHIYQLWYLPLNMVFCRYANESLGTFHKVWWLSLSAQRGNDNV